MMTIFKELINKRELEKRKKEVRVVCDFMNFLKFGVGMKFYVEQDLGNDEKGVLEIGMVPEQIDKLLLEFYEVLDGKVAENKNE